MPKRRLYIEEDDSGIPLKRTNTKKLLGGIKRKLVFKSRQATKKRHIYVSSSSEDESIARATKRKRSPVSSDGEANYQASKRMHIRVASEDEREIVNAKPKVDFDDLIVYKKGAKAFPPDLVFTLSDNEDETMPQPEVEQEDRVPTVLDRKHLRIWKTSLLEKVILLILLQECQVKELVTLPTVSQLLKVVKVEEVEQSLARLLDQLKTKE